MGVFSKRKKGISTEDVVNNVVHEELIERHSSAIKEVNISYTGVDNTTGKVLQKSLKGIHKYKRNNQNDLKAQAGYTAEVLDTMKRNVNAKMKGESTYYTRVDDIPGRQINETAYDITILDKNGKEIFGSASQMKFVGKNAQEQMDKLISKKWRETYSHGRYSVPKERYEDLKKLLSQKEKKLQEQIDSCMQNGKQKKAEEYYEQLNYVKKVDKNLVKSEVTSKEAQLATLNPKRIVIKESVKVGHSTGVNYAKTSAQISGTLSLVKNANRMLKGEIDAKEGAKNVAKDVAANAGSSYLVGQSTTIIKGIMKNSKKKILRQLSAKNVPNNIVVLAKDTIKALYHYGDGKITEKEALERIEKSAIGLAGASVGKNIAQNIFKGSMSGVFGLVGAVIGNIVFEQAFDYAYKLRNDYRYSKEERIYWENQYHIIQKEQNIFREQFTATYIAYTEEVRNVFGNSLLTMAKAMEIQDTDMFIQSANDMTKVLGGEIQYESVDEFMELLDSKTTLRF